RHVPQQATVATLAERPETAVAVDPGRHLVAPNWKAVDVPRRRSGEKVVLGILAVEALHRGAGAHPPPVPAADVHGLPQRDWQAIDSRMGQEFCARPAGPAGLVEDRADAPPRIARAVANQGELDLGAARPPVVEWHGDLGALESLLAGIGTLAPWDC